ncbi:MAG: hypothetical protein J6Q81_03605, partial [Lentisphaeria bacterium]|nr:hypothetical protein [Lentisphaeria bacterium]
REAYFEEIASALRLPVNRLFEYYRKQKNFSTNKYNDTAQTADTNQPPPAQYNDMRPEIIRHAEASLLLLALHSADGPRLIAEKLDENLLSDAPAAQVIRELMNMALNGEWFSGSELLNHLPEELAQMPDVIKLLMADSASLTPAQIHQILEDCPAELRKNYLRSKRQELLYELRETQDIVRQATILEELKKLRD